MVSQGKASTRCYARLALTPKRGSSLYPAPPVEKKYSGAKQRYESNYTTFAPRSVGLPSCRLAMASRISTAATGKSSPALKCPPSSLYKKSTLSTTKTATPSIMNGQTCESFPTKATTCDTIEVLTFTLFGMAARCHSYSYSIPLPDTNFSVCLPSSNTLRAACLATSLR